ncbi:MAG: CHAD domain-containing protein [Actinobacteria bacterium]|uniref:Unannotated protein n=1 Tax=freshwater metagenome TaxID=449393 RepID=A0A6J6E9X7_9ZZZZ|nr:CHAD domain-containing protein [Actinomycetota bacterium]
MPSTWWCSPATLDGAPTPVAAVELLRRAGFEFGAPQPTSRTLLDTADGRLHCAGARLEARPVYLPGTADAVELVADGGGLPTRRLIVERLPRRPDELPPGHLRDRLADLVGVRALVAQLTVTSQCAHALRRDGDGTPVARLELHDDVLVDLTERRHLGLDPRADVDDLSATAADTRPLTWCIEHHHLSGPPSATRRVRRALADVHAVGDGDALDRLAALADVDLDGSASSTCVRLRRQMRAEDAYRDVLHRLGDGVAATWQGAADDVDPEFLHDLRTALRRARTLLKGARHVLPEAARLDALSLADSLASLTGEARDLDVHVLDWPSFVDGLDPADAEALGPIHRALEAHRAAAHVRLRDALDGTGRTRWLAQWRAAIDAPPPIPGRRPRDARRRAGKVVADRLEQAHRRVLRDGRRLTPTAPAEAYHELRKDVKRLRATVDGFGSLAAPPHRRAYVARLKPIQDHLGRLQDTAVQRAEIDGFLRDPGDPGDPGDPPDTTRVALANVVATLDARHDELIASFAGVFGRFDRGGTQRALDRVLDDLRR